MEAIWRIELLGWLRARQGEQVISHFRTHKTGLLLAYLACYPERPHPREALIELLWPGCSQEAGRTSLSTALSSLRRQLEPRGVESPELRVESPDVRGSTIVDLSTLHSPLSTVILADRATVQLNPDRITTDVRAFECALGAATRARSPAERARSLTEAVDLYRGELLPGCSQAWVLLERERLAGSFFQGLSQLIGLLQPYGDRTLGSVEPAAAGDGEGAAPGVSPYSSVVPRWEWLRTLAVRPTPIGQPGSPPLDREGHPPLAREPATVAALLLRQLHQSRELERHLRQLLVEITPATPAPDSQEDRCGTATTTADPASRH